MWKRERKGKCVRGREDKGKKGYEEKGEKGKVRGRRWIKRVSLGTEGREEGEVEEGQEGEGE